MNAKIALANLYVEIWLAVRILPFDLERKEFAEILNLGDAPVVPRYRGMPLQTIAKAVRRVSRNAWTMQKRRCLQQGLIGYRYLKKAGYSPKLHFSVHPDSLGNKSIDAHCWVEVDENPVINDDIAGMVPIFTFPFAPRSNP